jgi:hypothetical protein
MRELLTSPATLRVLIYLIAPVLGMVPGVTIDQDAGTILLNINTALTGLAAGIAAGGGVFAIWGKK